MIEFAIVAIVLFIPSGIYQIIEYAKARKYDKRR